MNTEHVKAELRKEVRALQLDKKLNGHALMYWLVGVPEDDTTQALARRVIRMTDPALAIVSERTGYSFKGASADVLRVLAEEAYRVIELVQEQDEQNLQRVINAGILESAAGVQ
jgi:hypothetical protein